MSGKNYNAGKPDPISRRPAGNTEHSWCRAISEGTGVAVLTLQFSKAIDIPLLQEALRKLQNYHPILRSKFHFNPTKKLFSFVTPETPHIQIKPFDLSSTSILLENLSEKYKGHYYSPPPPLHMIQQHELNNNPWVDPYNFPGDGMDVFLASVYELPGSKWIVALRFQTAVCDRTTAVTLLRELMELAGEKLEGDEIRRDHVVKIKDKMKLGIEDLIPSGKVKKTLWAHGLDVLEYSVNSFRLTNLKFKDTNLPRFSEIARLQMDLHDTNQILAGCKLRRIKLCGALVAAGLIAAHSSRATPDQSKKYGVVTLTDCRSILDPPLFPHNFGFYHAAVLNSHTVKEGENFWDLATRTYRAYENSKKGNKHFTDMADLNFLMCKAIENPSLTASSSLRTSFISVFEDTVFDNSNQIQKGIGLDDYLGCASVHGVGPSIAFFDTIRDGKLDCLCVYPSPLHSRDQMEELVQKMKSVLIGATY